MSMIPDASVGLAFTSPPYNVGKSYESAVPVPLGEHLGLIERVAGEVYRVLVPGGRFVVNVANLGRKPYVPIAAELWPMLRGLGFVPLGEVIWLKGRARSQSCAWGSWRSASSPVVRDVHEYLLVCGKGGGRRGDRGESDIAGDEFVSWTLSVWDVPSRGHGQREYGKHPAPFPLELAERVVKLWSYVGDVVLDPFAGSGTTCVAAKKLGRRFVGFDVVAEYVRLAEARIGG